jgi:hypothetical protein
MQIIYGRENAEILQQKYTILPLETINIEGTDMEVFCLVSADHIGLGDLPTLEQYTNLHAEFLEGYKNKHYDYCRQCITYLMGKFSGELDSFYEEILRRIDEIDPPPQL